eukprot:1056600-Prymnesium_polylepis.1
MRWIRILESLATLRLLALARVWAQPAELLKYALAEACKQLYMPIFMLMIMLVSFSTLLVELEWSPAIDSCVQAWLDTGAVNESFIESHPGGVTWECGTVCGIGALSQSPQAMLEQQQLCATCGGFPDGHPECLG